MPDKSSVRVFFEDMLRLRVKPKPSTFNEIPVAGKGNTLGDFLQDLEGSNLLNISQIEQFRSLSSDRETQYRLYDEMAEDSIIASAIEMYADDATQYNSKGQVIWAESDDQDISAFANRLIDVLGLNRLAWSHIYSMVKYGDLYLETFRDDEINDDPLIKKRLNYSTVTVSDHKVGSVMEEYIEAVSNPAELFDLTKRGKTVGFIKTVTTDAAPMDPRYCYQHFQQGDETEVLPPDKYVHISLATSTNRFPEAMRISFKDDDVSNESGIKIYEYKINRGKSILHDIYKIYKEMSLMEDSLLLNRVTRSSIIRLLQIEVGDMPKNQARELLKRIKNMVEQKNYMDKGDGTYTSQASPGPIDNVIYIPTHNGKGQITSANLGGDVDVKSIADIDYFKNKMYGGLKIPKQFLGDTDDAAGFSGGTSLTKLDSRYARTIKRVQNAYIEGITTLINLFAISKGLEDHVNAFTVKMVSPSTMEDQERDETLDNRMNMIGTFMDLIGDDDITNPETRKRILLYFINNYLNEPDIAEIIDEDKSAEDSQEDESEDSDDSGVDFDSGGDFSTDFDSPDMDMGTSDIDTDIEFNSDESSDNSGDDFEVTPDEFGDFEDEF